MVHGHPWSYAFGSAIHFLWSIRNEELFQLVTPTMDEMLECFWQCFHSNHISSTLNSRLAPHSNRQVSFVSWSSPSDLGSSLTMMALCLVQDHQLVRVFYETVLQIYTCFCGKCWSLSCGYYQTLGCFICFRSSGLWAFLILSWN